MRSRSRADSPRRTTKSIVHRDIKPENVFITADGRVKILDFGLARQDSPVIAGATLAPTLNNPTEPGAVLGTVGYMAPEQSAAAAVDSRADIFAFGAMLYEMVTGRRAFQRETAAETMTAILREDPPEIAMASGVPPAIERIVRRCLEKKPEARFRSAHDLAFALEALSGTATRLGAGSRRGSVGGSGGAQVDEPARARRRRRAGRPSPWPPPRACGYGRRASTGSARRHGARAAAFPAADVRRCA